MGTLIDGSITAATLIDPDTRIYAVVDPSGTPLNRYVTGAVIAEFIRDTVGSALVEAGLIDIVVDDTANTITITSQDLFAARTWLYLPGGAFNGATTPDAAALDIAGDMEIVVRVAMDDWTPASEQALCMKANDTAVIQSWGLSLLANGRLRWGHYNGAANLSQDSSVATGITDGEARWLKATLDVDNGAAGYDVRFYTAPDQAYEPTAWTQLGTTQTGAGVTSIANSAYAASVGMTEDGGRFAVGKFGRAIVRTGIGGTVVADCNMSTPWSPRLRDSAGRVWSLLGSTYAWQMA